MIHPRVAIHGFIGTLFLAVGLMGREVGAIEPTREERSARAEWVATHWDARRLAVPFAFTYDGRPSSSGLPGWRLERTERRLDRARRERNLVWTDPDSSLEVRLKGIEYTDFPAVEWTVYFRNAGTNRTPVLSSIQAVSTDFGGSEGGPFEVRYATGAPTRPDDYMPQRKLIAAGEEFRLATEGGRPSQKFMPYFNLAWRDRGVVGAVGWPGQWAASFRADARSGLRFEAGQEDTHFRLEPGEEVRSPLIALVFWKGDPERAHNLWRAWMVAHNLPRPGGRLVPTHLVACSSHQFNEMLRANEENQKLFIDRYLAGGLGIDHWWMDAGWYVNDGSWVNTGTWEVDRKRFPNGLRAITDHAHAKGLKTIVWFEPERVTTNSWLFTHHPEWCLPAGRSAWRLLDLGNPEAWRWLVEHVDRLLVEQGIDLYRQDFNMDPLAHWRAHDTPERVGITENRYITGYLAYWDELRRRHPTLLIDSCASGGRRNDLETLRRAVPFLRSDHLFEPVSQQSHSYGASFWLPHHGTGTIVGPSELFKELGPGEVSTYLFRSHMCPTVIACWDVRRTDLDYARLRELTGQLRRVQPFYYGDYYPLTGPGLSVEAWMAWQFDRAELGGGVIQAFRRAGAADARLTVKPRGLLRGAKYEMENLDGGRTTRSGREWMEKGLTIELPQPASAAVIVYRRQR